MFKTDDEIRQKMIEYLTADEIMQQRVWEMIFPKKFRKLHYTFLQRIFSVRNQMTIKGKYKFITILGIKIKVKK